MKLWLSLVVIVLVSSVRVSNADTNISDVLSLIDEEHAETVAELYYREELGDVRHELSYSREIQYLTDQLTSVSVGSVSPEYSLRSNHVVFGLPRVSDGRYDTGDLETSLSLIIRESHVLCYADVLGSPIWVSQLWTQEHLSEASDLSTLPRDWKNDPALPIDYRFGTSYAGSLTDLDRGHMARHLMNRAWGFDSSVAGCFMTNSTPQHRHVNRGRAWRALEDEAVEFVKFRGYEVDEEEFPEFIWTISGAVFTPLDSSGNNDLALVGDGYSVPFATYKIVAFFNGSSEFSVWTYLFEQPYAMDATGLPDFGGSELPAKRMASNRFLVSVDALEDRTGIDFFPDLENGIEDVVESVAQSSDFWE